MARKLSLRTSLTLLAGLCCATAFAQSPVTVSIDTTSQGHAIPLDFSGLSFETGSERPNNAGTAGYFFSSSNTELITLFRNLGLKNLRMGGGSVDTEAAPSNEAIDNLFAFAQAAVVKVIYSVRMLNTRNSLPNLKADDAAIVQYVQKNYRANIHGFSIGNEPDWHNPYHTSGDPALYETTSGIPGTAYPSYLADWRDFVTTIGASTPEALFSGPDTGAYTSLTYTPDASTGVSWTQQFASDEAHSGMVANVTQHFYVGGSPGTDTAQQAIDDMLSANWVDDTQISIGPQGSSAYTPYPWLYNNNLGPVPASGLPYRLTESNDFVGGVAGASNAFASALWTLDYMHWWAAHGAAGVNFHNKQWILTDTIVPDPNPCNAVCGNYQTAPKGYGMKAFNFGGHGYVKPVTISNPDGINLTAYAVGDRQNLYLTMINKTHSSTNDIADARVTIYPNGFSSASAASMLLTDGSPGDASLLTATLGEASITNDSRWLGHWTPLNPDLGGSVTVTVPSTTAAIVKLHRAGNYVGPVELNENGALEVFATNAAGQVFHNVQDTAGGSESHGARWSGWSKLDDGVESKGAGAVVKNLDNSLEVFVPSTSGNVYHNRQIAPNGAWNGWSDLGGNGVSNLNAAANADGSLSVFGIGNDGEIWYASQSAPGVGWSDWSDLSGVSIQPGFVVGQNLDGRLEVLGVDRGLNVWHNHQTSNGGWSGWNSLSGVRVQSQLALARHLDGRLEVFGVDRKGNVWHNWQMNAGGGWQGWCKSGLSGQRIRPGFVVAQNSDGRIELFGVSGTADIWHIRENKIGNWSNWSKLGRLGPDPELVVANTADGRIQLFGTGRAGDIWTNRQTSPGGTWSGWTDFGGRGLEFYAGHH
ncbi:MAG: hypothetical protein JOZ62_13850 [Acidobacteriaceae bacterium]|nr:hypothetical protein [Acidobacteriaceae bacterium]